MVVFGKIQIMQKWKWEVCKMFMYMAFPVAMFHYFNSPQLFEEEVSKIKRENFPTVSSEKTEYVEQMIQELNAKISLRKLDEIEKNQKLKA